MDTVLAHPTALYVVVGLSILVGAFILISKEEITLRVMVLTAMLVSLSLILHTIKVFQMPQGGSITLASMVPLVLVSYAFGPRIGMLGGFTFGLLTLFLHPYIVHPAQVVFDYFLPFMGVGLAGMLSNRYVGITMGFALRFLSSVISGVVFFAAYAPKGMNVYWYSIVYNGTYIGPDLILTLIVFALLPTSRLLKVLRGTR